MQVDWPNIDDVALVLRDTASREIVHPLLALLEKPLQNSSYSAVESMFEIENELVEALTAETTRHISDALNTLMLKGDDAPLKAVLSEFFDEDQARQALKQFFDGFATADVWQEVRDLHALTRMVEEQTGLPPNAHQFISRVLVGFSPQGAESVSPF